jgi:3-hydroxybutyrate dehydrogenase
MAGVEGKIALVTGAGRGIGLVTARLLASRGAAVMCTARSEDELRATGLPWVAADLGTEDGCARAVDAAQAQLGPIDILVCNHGIGSALEHVVWEQDSAVWSETMRVNLDGPFHLSRLVLGGMVRRGYGRVVYTSSTAGLVAEPAGSAYNASKHGLIGLMRSVALDAGPYGVTSNAVLPGWVRTQMAENSAAEEARERGIAVDEVWQQRAALYPAGRVVSPQEVAETIAFLASEESSGINGEAVRVALGSLW